MIFKNNIKLQTGFVQKFWDYIHQSYTIERLYEETENVLVKLIDRDATYSLLYFKAKDGGKGIRVLDENNDYAAVLWLSNGKFPIGGNANSDLGLDLCKRIFSKLKKAIDFGAVEIIVEKCDIASSERVPLTEIEQKYLSLLSEGKRTWEVNNILEISTNIGSKIRKSIKRKQPQSLEEATNAIGCK